MASLCYQKREWSGPAQRSVAMGRRGMVTLSKQLITLADYKILTKGANAVDVCGAMISTPNVLEPHSVGLGGDAFAFI